MEQNRKKASILYAKSMSGIKDTKNKFKKIVRFMKNDKKNTSNLINLILLKKIGNIKLNLNFTNRKIYDFLKLQLMN